MRERDSDAEPDARDPVEALVEEFFARRRRGDRSDVEAFARRVPGRESEFRELVETLAALERAAGNTPEARGTVRSAASTATPERVGRHRLLGVVGHGGMGVVYEAVDEELGRRVALKVLPGHATLEEREIARFRREAQAAARLSHPHIVPLFGVGEDDGTHWLAMQFVPGRSLDALLRSQREEGAARLAPADVARHGLAIADALAYAHAEGVLHRDVKPSNLLLDASGTVWITDFGLAKSEGTATLTRTGETVGTPRYMAPEAFSGWADPRTDVWGLGATLYELLAGRPAFDGSDRAQLLKQISDVEPAPLRRVEPTVPRDLATIVHKCLQKEAAARYASARELADDLRRFLAGEPIHARPPSLVYRVSLIGRRHPTATLLLVVALAAGAIMTSREATRAHAAERRAEGRFDDVRKLAGAFLFEVHDAIRNLPGSTKARELVVKRSLEYLAGLAAESADDPGLRRELAAAYQKVGDVQGNPYQPNLGDLAGARTSYATAIALLEPVVASPDATDEDRALLASACLVGGGIAVATGSTASAVELSRRGLQLRQAIAAHDPSPLRREELATAWQYTAFSLTADRRNGEATEALLQQETLLRELLAAAPDSPSLQRSWGANRYLVANQRETSGDPAGAASAYVESLDLRRKLLAGDPSNTSLRRDVVWTLMNLGNLRADLGELAAAAPLYAEALTITRALAAADPDSTDAQIGIELAEMDLGATLVKMHRSEEALEHLDEAVRVGEAILARDPENAFAIRLLATALCNSGDANADLGDPASLETALDFYQRTLDLLAQKKAPGRMLDPENRQAQLARNGIAYCEARLAR